MPEQQASENADPRSSAYFAMFGATILVPVLVNTYFPRRRLIHSGNTVLRRNRNSAVPLNDTF